VATAELNVQVSRSRTHARGRTLNEWSARRRGRYLHNRRTYPCTLRSSNPRSQLSSGFSLPTCRPHGHQHHKIQLL